MEFILIEGIVILILELCFVSLPDGDHAVEDRVFFNSFIFGFLLFLFIFIGLFIRLFGFITVFGFFAVSGFFTGFGFFSVFGFISFFGFFVFAVLFILSSFGVFGILLLRFFVLFDFPLRFDDHFDRIADIIGIFLYKILQSIGFGEFVIILFLGIILEIQSYNCSEILFFDGFYSITVKTFGFPFPCFVRTVSLCAHGYAFCNHECGIEAYTELTYDIHVVFDFFGVFFLELKCSALCNGSEVFFKIFLRHADAVIGYRERSCFPIGC